MLTNKISALSLLLLVSSLSQAGIIKSNSIHTPARIGTIALHHSEDGFFVEHQDGITPVQTCYMDRDIRNISKKELATLLAAGSYIDVNQSEEGVYSLKLNGRVRGGGVAGATAGAYAGKFLISFLGHGTILAISAFTGPAAPATAIALEGTFGWAIEAASMAGAVAGGVAGGVATGPV